MELVQGLKDFYGMIFQIVSSNQPTTPQKHALDCLEMLNCPVETHSTIEHYRGWRKTCYLLVLYKNKVVKLWGGSVEVWRTSRVWVRLESGKKCLFNFLDSYECI